MPANHTSGPWIDSPEAGDAIISTDPDVIHAEIEADGLFTQAALDHYGGFVICESVYAKNKSLIKAAPDLLKAIKPLIDAASNLYRQIESVEGFAHYYQRDLRDLKRALFDAKQAYSKGLEVDNA
jgi:hypothetical protein